MLVSLTGSFRLFLLDSLRWQELFPPDFLCDFPHKAKLCPLLLLGQLISDLTGCKSALWTQIQSVERNILCSFTDSVNHCLFLLKYR